MSFLRSKLFVLLTAALVFAGYGTVLFGSCDDEKSVTIAGTATAAVVGGERGAPSQPSSSSSHPGDHVCPCLCHQVFANEQWNAPAVTGATVDAEFVFPEVAKGLPDAVPLGIDHPPQLA